ncbi:MAG: glutamate 5-kinase [Alphaproteobacteria bacterium]|nr:glutamate 5-kinase [Alphaproteobacteria bacterium]MAS48687.1 glutamate 5-kinase [Alphaproteobacteria bacterium]MAX96868.1 glutamate 5-kinase [Alphaproteobacteria bacterium]MBN54610.1 glutamate 5-kinase [Alphaproteobacteria bacterium]OUT39325.1 MAG: glutamate 5-kinase [Micavibrio sp. TMED2]|tara:strand:+ start:6143 stop:7306 length:1164 start_codon:yes stop_codon:yes gene_type:complete
MRHLDAARRFVVKIGSALLVDDETGTIRRAWLESLALNIADARKAGQDVIIVSSGAIALGRRLLGLPTGKLKLEEKQAAAAAGQVLLAHHYQAALAAHGVPAAQLLLTPDDTEDRRRHLNARATLSTLLSLGAVPVINENDTVATAEIRFGDNDRLGARVAQMSSADTLILLSDVQGLYTADPTRNSMAKRIGHIPRITPEIEAMAGGAQSGVGTGGMVTKIAAAKIATAAGCHVLLGNGHALSPLSQFREDHAAATGEAPFSWFEAVAEPIRARKSWIVGHVDLAGRIRVDAGAVRALNNGRSLLPAGVALVTGSFERGDIVAVDGPDGIEIARGITAYSSEDAMLIAGHHSQEIESILGFAGREEMIHRDDLAMTQQQDGANHAD